MTAFLFLQKFDNGVPASMPFQAAMNVLGRHGTQGRGAADLEFTFEPDTVAMGCTVIGDPASGVACIGFERPRYDDALRRLVWECMSAFGCAAFDDTLDTVYVPLDGAPALPPGLAAAGLNGVRRIGGAQQLWPDQLEAEVDDPPRPALRYQNPNSNGPHLQMFDDIGANTREIGIEMGLRREACNAGTLRVIRNMELRVHAAVSTNPEFHVMYRYADQEASLQVMESPRLWDHPVHATIVFNSLTGEVAPRARFIVDREVFAATEAQAADFVRYVQDKYKIDLDGGPGSIVLVAKLLDQLHAHYARERDAQLAEQSAGQPFSAPIATNWAIKAGCYLGSVIRRHVGAQWGYVTRGSRRLMVVRTHDGRVHHPHLQVLDHVVNGPLAGIAAWFEQLAATNASATPRTDDLACNIPGYCAILGGVSQFDSDGLPLESELPRDRLDFSVGSLRHLDIYLSIVAQRRAKFSEQALSNLVLAAGAYFGEVVRSAAPSGTWLWENYDDYVKRSPEFAAQRPRQFGFMAFLDSDEQTAYPLAHVLAMLSGASVPRTEVMALQLLGPHAGAGGKPAAAGRAASGQNAVLQPATINAWPADAAMAVAIEEARTTLAKWRGMATSSDRAALRAQDPGWLMQSDSLGEVLARQVMLLQRGTVVWGALVQANGGLFEPGPDDLPAALAYSPDPHFDARPQALRRIAQELFAHKGEDAPGPLKRIGALLADEVERAYNVPIPDILTDKQVLLSVFLVFRKHMPEEVLNGAWFPILTHPDTRSVMILPRQFWSNGLIRQWEEGELTL